MKLDIVFMGTPNFSVNVLQGLIDNYNVKLVVTQPDKLVGRKQELRKTPVKVLAEKYNIEVFQPEKIKENYQRIIDVNPDIIITCAYGQMIPHELLEYPKYKCINVHASLLPNLRGGAPIHHAIIDGYKKTGVTIMYMIDKMDAGDIISQQETVIEDNDTVETLHDRLSIMGTKLLLKTLPEIINNQINPIKQDEEKVTYGMNIKREEELIDFNDSIINIYNKIRGLSPFPGAYAKLNNKIIKIYNSNIIDCETNKKNGIIIDVDKNGIKVAINNKILNLYDIQFEGKKRMLVKDLINGINKEELIGKEFNKDE